MLIAVLVLFFITAAEAAIREYQFDVSGCDATGLDFFFLTFLLFIYSAIVS